MRQDSAVNSTTILWRIFFYWIPLAKRIKNRNIYVVVIFLSQLIFIFRLFLGMVMNANEFETKEI